jgi:ABC-type lipoprotein release transport system permease subunit
LLLSLGGLILGAALGFGLTAWREMTNVLVRQEKDLEGLVPTRVLVGIPHLNTPGEDRFHAAFHRLEIGTVAVMALLILAGNLYAFYKS